MTETKPKPMGRDKVTLVVVSVIAVIVIIVYFLTRDARARSSDVCGPGFELTYLPEYGGWRCFDGETVQIPLCPDGKFWDRENGKCVTECPPDYTPSPAGECIHTGHVPDRITVRGRLLEGQTGQPVDNHDVFIEYLFQGGIINEQMATGPDGIFIFDIPLEGVFLIKGSPIWLIVETWDGGGWWRQTREGVTADIDFGDISINTLPPPPPEFNRVYQVTGQLPELPFDPAFPLYSYWKVACDPIDLTGVSGEWMANVFNHDWGQSDCPGQSGLPDENLYFFFKRNDGIYFVIKEGTGLYESWQIGGPW